MAVDLEDDDITAPPVPVRRVCKPIGTSISIDGNSETVVTTTTDNTTKDIGTTTVATDRYAVFLEYTVLEDSISPGGGNSVQH